MTRSASASRVVAAGRSYRTGGGIATGRTPVEYLLYDTFTDADGTPLRSHKMNFGPGWTDNSGGVAEIDSNTAQFLPVAPYVDVGQADCVVQATVNLSDPNQGGAGILGRVTDDTHKWMIEMFAIGAFQLIEKNGGLSPVRAESNFDIQINTNYVIRVTFSGTTITATVDGAHSISYASATFNQTATRFGIVGEADNDAVDNFIVTAVP